jgi:membrane associated rhomboid family serine protease
MLDDLRKPEFWPTVTLGFSTIFIITYIGQLLLVGSLSPNAGFQAATKIQDLVGGGSVVFSWMFHSSYSHLGQNIVVFVLTGWWVESRIDQDRFILGVAVLLGIGANVAGLALFGTPGAGISGITTGLVTMVVLGNLERVYRPNSHIIRNSVVFTISGCYLLYLIGVIGMLPPGTAVKIHISGAFLAFVWYSIEKFQYGLNPALD